MVCASKNPPVGQCAAVLQLMGWCDDDLIEYLLARHPARCASVMNRILPCADRDALAGIPEVWACVLEAMARDGRLLTVEAALRKAIYSKSYDPLTALKLLTLSTAEEVEGMNWPSCSLMRQRPVQVLVAADGLVADLSVSGRLHPLASWLPRDLVIQIARRLRTQSEGLATLAAVLGSSERKMHAMAASILFAVNGGWQPEEATAPDLGGAYLAGAQWPGISLPGVTLVKADLSKADLTHADLDGIMAAGVFLGGAAFAGLDARGESYEG